MSIRSSVLYSLAAVLIGGCATNHVIVTSGAQQARESAGQEQRTADQYRALGAPEAARQAQERADEYRAKSDKKSRFSFEWFANALFSSWLSTQSAAANVKPGP
jgi:hypothetical protein